jgi:Mrp family chromosome partitioning ATPase
MRSVVKEARRLAHIVLIDTAPLLAEADAAHLLSDVDAVLVVAREGYTTVDLAERGSDILERLAAPVAGVVLNDATQGDMPRYYFPSDVANPSRNDDVSQEADTAREAETSQGIDTSQDADSSTGMAETSPRKRVGGIPN